MREFVVCLDIHTLFVNETQVCTITEGGVTSKNGFAKDQAVGALSRVASTERLRPYRK